jgi:hypothetical protein
VQTVNFQNKSQIIRQIGDFCNKLTGKPPENCPNSATPTAFGPARHLSPLATKMRFWRRMSTFYLIFKFFVKAPV